MQVRYQLRQRPSLREPYHQPLGRHGGQPVNKRFTSLNSPIVPTIAVVMTNTSTSTSPLPDLSGHLQRIAEDGYTVLPDAIEPDLVTEIGEALDNLEHDLGVRPADNLWT